MSDRREPEWASPNEVVLECPVATLRDFSQGSRKQVVPTLVLPPQAGHSSSIVDYSAEQSQMQVIRAAGLERAYSMEWVGATQDTKHYGIGDYLVVRRALGGAHRRPGQPDRRLPGRLAGRHLRGAAPRAGEHAHAGRRPDRLPRRRGPDHRVGPHAVLDRRHGLLRGPRGLRRRRHAGRLHPRRLRRDQAGERGRQAAAAAGQPRRPGPPAPLRGVRGLVQAHPGPAGRLLPVDRARSCSATTS